MKAAVQLLALSLAASIVVGVSIARAAEEPQPNESTAKPAAESAPERSFSWQRGDDKVALLDGDHVVWQFNYGKDQDKPHFYPVGPVGGPQLTWDRPPDHVWHRALWFSWKYINGVNYWEPDMETMKMVGMSEPENVTIKTNPNFSARIAMNLVYHPKDAKPVLTEKRVIVVTPPRRDGSYAMDWKLRFTVGDEPIVLDRTPLPNEPEGKPWGGYAGLSVRFAKEMQDRAATTIEGVAEFDGETYRGHSMAMDYSGTFDGKAAGVAILDNAANTPSPTPWYAIRSDVMSYFSPAVIHDAPLKLQPGDTISLDYRVIIHPGRWTATRLTKALERYAATAKPAE